MTDQNARWADAYADLAEHVNRTGRQPSDHHDTIGVRSGVNLGRWARHQRRLHRGGDLPADRGRQLETLPGWTWTPRHTRWADTYAAVADHLARTGRYPPRHRSWISRQQLQHTAGTLPVEHAEQLAALPGWTWTVERWADTYADLADHINRTGRYPSEQSGLRSQRSGVNLGGWLRAQRNHHHNDELPAERVRQLEALPGWTWTPLADAWQDAYTDTVGHINRTGRYPSQHTASRGQRSGIDLGQWLKWQRLHHRRGTLPADRARQLEALPAWTWGRTRSGR